MVSLYAPCKLEARAAKHSDKIVKDIIVLLTRVTGARCVRQELLSSCFRQIGHKMCGEAKSGNLRRMYKKHTFIRI